VRTIEIKTKHKNNHSQTLLWIPIVCTIVVWDCCQKHLFIQTSLNCLPVPIFRKLSIFSFLAAVSYLSPLLISLYISCILFTFVEWIQVENWCFFWFSNTQNLRCVKSLKQAGRGLPVTHCKSFSSPCSTICIAFYFSEWLVSLITLCSISV